LSGGKSKMTSVVPSVFATDIKGFRKRMLLARKLSKEVHVDFMDGIFVNNKSPAIKDMYNIKGATVHLMAINPERYFEELAGKRCPIVVVHYEECKDRLEKTVRRAHNLSMKCFLAINPETQVNVLFTLLNKVDGFLLMSVQPGSEHQTIDEHIFARVKELRRLSVKPILVDGGVRIRNAARLKRAGASVLAVGSVIFRAMNPEDIFRDLKKKIEG
jgi:ribulose-phosphate 3-epimerase